MVSLNLVITNAGFLKLKEARNNVHCPALSKLLNGFLMFFGIFFTVLGCDLCWSKLRKKLGARLERDCDGRRGEKAAGKEPSSIYAGKEGRPTHQLDRYGIEIQFLVNKA